MAENHATTDHPVHLVPYPVKHSNIPTLIGRNQYTLLPKYSPTVPAGKALPICTGMSDYLNPLLFGVDFLHCLQQFIPGPHIHRRRRTRLLIQGDRRYSLVWGIFPTLLHQLTN